MATITAIEAEQVERANAAGKRPVVFIHGLWVRPRGWNRWAEVFEQAGYAAVTPSGVLPDRLEGDDELSALRSANSEA